MTAPHSPDRDSVAELLAACAERDRAALRRLFEMEGPSLLALARRIVRRADVAEEVVQDAFVQIWRRASSFDPARGTGRGWVYAVVRNRALSHLRDERHVPVEDLELQSYADAQTDVDDAFARLSAESALRRCLARLDAKPRTSVLLAHVAGLSHGEIAERLGAPLGTVKTWIRRSLIALKECMT
ncbi:sigma-70 family RNA polymerase sigma factor [Methylopila henanensis]